MTRQFDAGEYVKYYNNITDKFNMGQVVTVDEYFVNMEHANIDKGMVLLPHSAVRRASSAMFKEVRAASIRRSNEKPLNTALVIPLVPRQRKIARGQYGVSNKTYVATVLKFTRKGKIVTVNDTVTRELNGDCIELVRQKTAFYMRRFRRIPARAEIYKMKYGHLQDGHQRMILGQAIRMAMKYARCRFLPAYDPAGEIAERLRREKWAVATRQYARLV